MTFSALIILSFGVISAHLVPNKVLPNLLCLGCTNLFCFNATCLVLAVTGSDIFSFTVLLNGSPTVIAHFTGNHLNHLIVSHNHIIFLNTAQPANSVGVALSHCELIVANSVSGIDCIAFLIMFLTQGFSNNFCKAGNLSKVCNNLIPHCVVASIPAVPILSVHNSGANRKGIKLVTNQAAHSSNPPHH